MKGLVSGGRWRRWSGDRGILGEGEGGVRMVACYPCYIQNVSPECSGYVNVTLF